MRAPKKTNPVRVGWPLRREPRKQRAVLDCRTSQEVRLKEEDLWEKINNGIRETADDLARDILESPHLRNLRREPLGDRRIRDRKRAVCSAENDEPQKSLAA